MELNTEFLNEIEAYAKSIKYGLNSFNRIEEIAEKFNLRVLNTSGTTRAILKRKGSPYVLKLGYPSHNYAEYVLSRVVSNTKLSELFAHCHAISKEGYVLVQDFVYKHIPHSRGIAMWFDDTWISIRNRVEKMISEVVGGDPGEFDIHEENIHISRGGDLKIVDYSNVLVNYFHNSNDIEKVEKKLKKKIKDLPSDPLFFYKDGSIILLYDGDRIPVDLNNLKASPELRNDELF